LINNLEPTLCGYKVISWGVLRKPTKNKKEKKIVIWYDLELELSSRRPTSRCNTSPQKLPDGNGCAPSVDLLTSRGTVSREITYTLAFGSQKSAQASAPMDQKNPIPLQQTTLGRRLV